MGKPRGLRTARKLKNHRREQKWNDKDYKKSHLGKRWKSNLFDSFRMGGPTDLEIVGVEAKQPNSAIRKYVRVYIKQSYQNEQDKVLVAGFGRKGHAGRDIPGVRFKGRKSCQRLLVGPLQRQEGTTQTYI
ncbi:hypothetical protein HELRODRAFT_157568 [Helobdella robusta]|uniref:Small ribosomal subunit protein uS12 n=1 Tax=Helobdella robusta TaxID=6412 RepID=T1EMD2_HELRO|nr:hypothetical protein HELRODRAFT_157568 [Helobdella robusta]ESN97393.1 hypothetical protein HELRODRAFT_157568 [Helobdella robusta]